MVMFIKLICIYRINFFNMFDCWFGFRLSIALTDVHLLNEIYKKWACKGLIIFVTL